MEVKPDTSTLTHRNYGVSYTCNWCIYIVYLLWHAHDKHFQTVYINTVYFQIGDEASRTVVPSELLSAS